jgi:hypothetical protein
MLSRRHDSAVDDKGANAAEGYAEARRRPGRLRYNSH